MVRAGRPKDLPSLMQLASEMKNESEVTRDISLDEEKISRIFKRGFDVSDPHVCIFVCESRGRLRGAILGAEVEYFFSKERYAADLFLYVVPSCRASLLGGVVARRLWQAWRDWAQERGVREIRNGVSTGISVEASHRLFISFGMTHIGGLYSLAIDRGKSGQ